MMKNFRLKSDGIKFVDVFPAGSYLVHAVLLDSEPAAVSVRGLGHVLQLLLLQAGVLRGNRLPQLVDAAAQGVRRLADAGRQRDSDRKRPCAS